MNELKKLIAHKDEEICKLNEHIHNLTQSRDFWKTKATKLAKKLNDVQKGRSKNGT
jgi:hypothetical protein